ncbi:endolytic transglycosylase MltG [Paraglaciecola sp. MB-3u-78]|uniref:endolytic transglycosylase MltG n=1 Tax=Paraglaciecola sp. MB-3u-78 TaxID=2058332 RepID=UPI000C324BDF|nr:endolytic transglycosylase MltG [Paraglaciecola sp. MB-3u-78]PKG99450.1 endolytic transglycosylase MltG [Paraglaciecola sp. MB-3u-78]
MKIIKWLSIFAFLIGIIFVVTLFHFDKKVHQQINITEAMVYQVKSGQSAKGIVNRLKDQGVISDNIGLKIRLKLEPELANIKVGTYELLPSMSALDLLELFSSGKEMQFSIGLIEGLNWREWLLVLKAHPQIKFNNDFQQQLDALSAQLPEQSIEGYLLPDTYHFVAQTAAIELVKRAHLSMQQYLDGAWESRALDLPYASAYEGLIMASIIEKETGVPEERPRISGVFVNRLNLNMRLQTDPTVIYGIGEDFDGNIRRKDLKTATPYNTYVIKGLPPTPIAMPSKLAIDAAFNPLTTEELYFVSKGDGSHKFSTTLQEHNLAVRKYQLNK